MRCLEASEKNMAYELRYLATAHEDILEADAYMSEESPDRAKRFLALLDVKLLQLRNTPFMYQVYEEYPIYRRIVIWDYLIFYLVNETEGVIDVHRVINSKMHVIKRLLEMQVGAE